MPWKSQPGMLTARLADVKEREKAGILPLSEKETCIGSLGMGQTTVLAKLISVS
jgi:hypothetical protein